MSATIVHQALHGYRRGHELLAGSIRLPSSASDVVTRLSDLSGSIASGWDFTGYVTGYPVAGAPYFAIARTWEDKKAARAGCVLTHTLLVPIDAWRTSPDPRAFSKLFALESDLRDDERFKKTLQVEAASLAPLRSVYTPRGSTMDFVRKYFGEGLRPLIWIDCLEPEEVAWAITKVLWPALREQFSWCTASLQPRAISTKSLDLQFVPAAAYSRFHKFQRDNFVEGEKVDPSAEPWCAPCAQWIFSGSRSGPIDAEIRAFGSCLRDDPTLMRHLFLAKDLLDRVDSSPTAGAGLLDVTEALAPKPEEAVEYKSKVARKAVEAATAALPDEALKCLFLVGERLTNEAFRAVADVLGKALTASVDRLSFRHPREALVMPERGVSRADVGPTPYFRGIVRGLIRCAKEAPSELVCLQEFNKTAPRLIAAAPRIAGGFLRCLQTERDSTGGWEALVSWIAGLGSPDTWHELRQEVLPEVRTDLDAGVVDLLCRELPAEEVGEVLTALDKATNGFAPEKVLTTLHEVLAGPRPEEVRAWARPKIKWSSGVTSLVSATFSNHPSGLKQVVEFGPDSGERRAALLTAFLATCTAPRVPGWLKDVAAKSSDWLIPLLSLGSDMPPRTLELLDRLVPELRQFPLATHTGLRSSLAALSGFGFWPALADLILRDALTGFVEGRLSEFDCHGWFTEGWASDWAWDVSRGDLAAALTHPVHDSDQRERAFRWLAFAPSPLYMRQATLVPDLFWELVTERRHGWNPAMGSAWAETIRRAHHSTPGISTLRMCADVLQFGFDHTGETIGAAVAAAFYPVYRAVCDSDRTPQEVSNLFGWFDWDKAKELRKGLVRSFLRSNWNPGDLALAACEDEQLLRKLVKRVLRNDNDYVSAMLNDLVSRRDPSIARTVEMVRNLASNPDFHEPWD